MPDAKLIRLIDALLPQTQCGQCGHPGCQPYAEAIAAGEAINHCVPGGQTTIDALAGLLDKPTLALDPEYGVSPTHRLVAYIREAECIGCTKCIQACPVDAIVGAAKLMHTVMIDECTGCDLCVAPCPVDCIDMVPGPDIPVTWHRPGLIDPASGHVQPSPPAPASALEEASRERADRARSRFLAHKARLAAIEADRAARRDARQQAAGTTATSAADLGPLMIAAAMARSQLKKVEKQLAALQARAADTTELDAALPGLRATASQAQTALEQAQRGEAPDTTSPSFSTPTEPEAQQETAPEAAAPVKTGPGSKRVRTTGDIR